MKPIISIKFCAAQRKSEFNASQREQEIRGYMGGVSFSKSQHGARMNNLNLQP
jgi:hypothetical protein